MKSLIVSFISIAMIIGGWCIFVNYSDRNIHQLIDAIDNDVMASVDAGDWEKASEQIGRLSDRWHDQKKVYTFFFDTSDIKETEYSIKRAEHYIKAQDVSLASGELNLVRAQLEFLHMNELITLDNIF